jgi:hypothetical protein
LKRRGRTKFCPQVKSREWALKCRRRDVFKPNGTRPESRFVNREKSSMPSPFIYDKSTPDPRSLVWASELWSWASVLRSLALKMRNLVSKVRNLTQPPTHEAWFGLRNRGAGLRYYEAWFSKCGTWFPKSVTQRFWWFKMRISRVFGSFWVAKGSPLQIGILQPESTIL